MHCDGCMSPLLTYCHDVGVWIVMDHLSSERMSQEELKLIGEKNSIIIYQRPDMISISRSSCWGVVGASLDDDEEGDGAFVIGKRLT